MFILVIFQANFHSCCLEKIKCSFLRNFSVDIHKYNIITFTSIVSKLIENQINFDKTLTASWVELVKDPFRISATQICLAPHMIFGMLILNCSVLHDKLIPAPIFNVSIAKFPPLNQEHNFPSNLEYLQIL